MSLIRKAFKRLHYPADVIAQCVRWYLTYSLSLRNLGEMMAELGIIVEHSTFHRWVIGYGYIAQKFDDVDGYGPTSVRKFIEETRLLGERTPEQWQQDVFGQVDIWLRALNLRT